MWWTLLACTDGGFPPVVIGKADTADSAWWDSPLPDSEPPDDSGDDSGDDSQPPDDSASLLEVCYLGSDRKGDTCFEVVDWQASWGADYDYPDPLDGDSQYSKPLRYLDLDTLDSSTKLAPNFAMGEFMLASKGQYGLFQPHAVETLQDIRDELGGPVEINSGYRNVTYNAGVGGATWSRHMYGDAADIAASGWSLEELGDVCTAHGADYIGFYESHVHCDWRESPLEPAFYEAGPSGPRPPAPTPLPVLSGELRPGAVWTAPAQGWDEGEPLREWTAFGAKGEVLAQARGRSFVPPEGAARVRVELGRSVRLEAEVPKGR